MSIDNGKNQLWINNLYDNTTPELVKDHFLVRVFDNRSEYMQSGEERPATGAIVALEDSQGSVILASVR